MNRLQLATLLDWAGEGGIQGRKRLQKVVYCLQRAGCPLDCDYTLHHYGPYSRDVADICDEMVTADLVVEDGGPASGGGPYTYRLTERTRRLLRGTADETMPRFEEVGKRLISEKIWPLELGSTILLFHDQGHDWPQALEQACKFKDVPADTPASTEAMALAQEVMAAAAK